MSVARLEGPDRLPLAEYAARLWHTHTWREIAERAQDAIFGGQYAPSEGQVKAAYRDYDRLRARHGNGADTGGGESARDTATVAAGEPETTTGVDERRRARIQYLRSTYEPPAIMKRHVTRTVIGVGDMHGKFDSAVLREIVALRPDYIIYGGDTFDNQHASAHKSTSRQDVKHRTFERARESELNMRADTETILSETEACIKVIWGNHDNWVFRKVAEFWPEYIRLHYHDPLELFVDGLGERCRLVGHPVTYHYPDGTQIDAKMHNEYMYVFGDVLFSHMNKTAKHPGAAVQKLYLDWALEWQQFLGLSGVGVFVQFHGHKRAMQTRAAGHVLLIEPGMGGESTVENYKVDYSSQWSPGVHGFVWMTQYLDEGKWRTDARGVQLVAPRMWSPESLAPRVARGE